MPVSASAAPAHPAASSDVPRGALAIHLIARWQQAGSGGLLYIASSERQAEHLAANLHALDPALDVVVFPRWDCLPYDQVGPSREIMGRRTSVLRRLSQPTRKPPFVIATPDALLQRVPPATVWRKRVLTLRVGDALAPSDLQLYLERSGYMLDERVDEPGEAALRGHVVDLYPGGALGPLRIEHADGRITAMHDFDAASQRTIGARDDVVIDTASEIMLPDGKAEDSDIERFPGMEHWLPSYYDELATLFDYLPRGEILMDGGAEARGARWMQQIRDSYEARNALPASIADGGANRKALAPERLYLDAAEWAVRLASRSAAVFAPAVEPGPRFTTESNPTKTFRTFVAERLAAGQRVVLTAADDRGLRVLLRRAAGENRGAAERAGTWQEVLSAAAGTPLTLRVDFERGFSLPSHKITVIAAADLLGSRAAHETPMGARPVDPLGGEAIVRPGDAVVHLDHGIGLLRGLETVSSPGLPDRDTLRIGYANDADLMVPVEEIGAIWRYGAEADAVSLDRLGAESWPKRRVKVEAEIEETAHALAALARQREARAAPKLLPPAADYERFIGRFPFFETADQAQAIEDVLDDLASGRPMDRLVCGDVGFGKTEVALRAAAAAALSGRQVAVVVPTTVLARQHIASFRRRFAGFGIEVGHLSRLVKPKDARQVKQGLAEGSIHIVVGTHAVTAKDVRFKDLGLVILDEEQRFGTREKAKLRAFGEGVHRLTLTATPIPRTLQSAMVGLQSLSVIATPPTRRVAIRTVLLPYDPALAREALHHEKRRGGQSFVVCPRIEDIEPMTARLNEIVPKLKVRVAHGKMPADDIDDTMVQFADGDGDVLLATNIIESGLDLPRANTMLIWRPDRFGIAQLHQLRGRVGRGNRAGITYLFTDPETGMSAATEKRLRAFESLNRLGAGFAISARDMDLRGAGDLLGEQQTGHVKLIGIDLYRHMLERALAAARGEKLDSDWSPELRLDFSGLIPADYVPEPEVRIGLYARLARLHAMADIEAFDDEIADRFGEPPEAVQKFLGIARVRQLCRRLDVARVDCGPQALALTFRAPVQARRTLQRTVEASGDKLRWHDERLISARTDAHADGYRFVLDVLQRLA